MSCFLDTMVDCPRMNKHSHALELYGRFSLKMLHTRKKNKKTKNLNDMFRFSAQPGNRPSLDSTLPFFFTKNVHSLCDLTSLWLEKSFFFLSNNHVLFVSFDSHNSHELQTCDWPRNVGCLTGADAVAAAKTKASSRPSNVDQKLGSPLTQFLDSE